jgi:FixJ family two-component response regulator
MTSEMCTVYVVDDDPGVREAMDDLLSACGFRVVTFGCAEEYQAFHKEDDTACLVLDVDLPDVSGLDLQSQLAAEEHPPIVFITGHGDIPSSVRAIKAGAIDFLSKPLTSEQLLGAIVCALEQHRGARSRRADQADLKKRHESLTAREREVLPLIVRGLLNKQAAAALGISEVTLQIHRGNIMRKMAAESFADLVRMSMKLGIEAECSYPPVSLVAG